MFKGVIALCFIIATRFFGLFILLPVLSLYAMRLEGANELLVGLLIGSYALAQMLLQVPFGVLSDKIGRKKTLLLGLLIFIIGSLICIFAKDIYMMIFGRIVQGCGAIGAVAVAMINDFVKEDQRSRAFMIMGMFIGLSFATSMVLSPFLSEKFGLESLFYLSIALTLLCIVLLFTLVPKVPKIIHQNQKSSFLSFFIQKDLALMNMSNFLQKMLMSLSFMILPLFLKDLNINLTLIYSLSMIVGFLAMGLSGSLGDKRGLNKFFLLIGVIGFFLAFLCFDLSIWTGFAGVFYAQFFCIAAGIIFFIAFNLHEPILQSCASAFIKANERGAALGVFNTFGYAGSFLGGILGGILLHFRDDFQLIFAILLAFILLWFILLCFLKNPNSFKTLYIKDKFDEKAFKNMPGIIEIYKSEEYWVLKLDTKIIDEKTLKESIKF